jgi:hypothetical protein
MPRIGAIFSILLALSFISLAFAPVAEPVAATDWEDYAVVGGGAVAGAAIGTAVADGPGAVAGAAIGAVLAFWWLGQDEDARSAFSAGAKSDYARSLKNTTDTYLGLASAAAKNQLELYDGNQMFFTRKAEWAALQLYQEQTAAGVPHVWDSKYVLWKSDVANGSLVTTWAIAQQYEAILNYYSHLTDTFTGTYTGMDWGYKSGSNDVASSQTLKPYRIAKVGYTWFTSNTNYVTVSAGSPIIFINTDTSDRTTSLSIKDRSGTEVFSDTITVEKNGGFEWNAPVSGDYMFSWTSGGIYAFGLVGKPVTNAVSLTPTIVTGYQSSVDPTKIMWDMLLSQGSSPKIWFENSGDASMQCNLASIHVDLIAAANASQQAQATALSLAQAYYNTLVSTGGGDNRIYPDIVFPDPEGLKNRTAEEIYAIYLAYLTQQQDWFTNYSVMDPSSVNISAESLSLKLLGSIYYANGTLMYPSGTVFTPFVSTADMVLKVGQRNNMTQPGFAIVWGSATDLDSAGRMTNIRYVPLAVGDYFIIDEMQRDGTPVTEETLKVTTVQYYIYDQSNPITPPQGATDLEWLMAHWYWFAIIAGAIFVAAWAFTRNTALGAIGLILVGVGAVFWIISDASVTTGLLSGLFRR